MRVLTDEIPPALRDQIETSVRKVEDVHDPIRVRARMSGNRTFVDVVAHVPGNLSLKQSHALADRIEEAVRVCVDNVDVMVHLEPTGKHRSTHEG